MNDRGKQILKVLRCSPLIRRNEITDTLQISHSRVATHTIGLICKGLIKGRGYILTEQGYYIVVGAINMDIRGVADIRYPRVASHPGFIHCSAGDVGHDIARNLALLNRDVHLISVIGDDFYDETLLKETCRVDVNVSNCIRLYGRSITTYLAIANKQEETILAINGAHILQQLTPQLLSTSRGLIRRAGMVPADYNLIPGALKQVFTITDEIPMFVNTVSEFKTNKIKNWYSRVHTLRPTQNELEILWGQPIKDDSDRIRTVNSLRQQGVKRIFICLRDESMFCSGKGEE